MRLVRTTVEVGLYSGWTCRANFLPKTFPKKPSWLEGTGQSEAIPSVGSWSFVLARPGLEDEVAARLAKALRAAEAAPSPQLADTTVRNTLAAATPSMLHPGVLAYYRQAGLGP